MVEAIDNGINDINAAIARRSNWDPIWNDVPLGLQDEVYPNLKLEMSPIVTGTTGKKNILGHRFEGVTGTIKVQMRQISRKQALSLAPWNTGAAAELTPPLNADFYQWAEELILHPTDMKDDNTEDVVFAKASPISVPLQIKKDGSKDDVWEVDFAVYPDRERLAKDITDFSIGRIGR